MAQELVWARYGDADSLDPHRATSTLSMQVRDQLCDTLLAVDMDGTPGPNLAKSGEVSDDGLDYTFALNEGILCHDSTPFDAEDVKSVIDRAFGDTPSLTKTSWGPITGVEILDPLTFKVTMSSKFGAFIPFLADSFSSMVCDTNTAETFGSSTAIGVGPFKLVEWVKGDQIVLEKNRDFVNLGDPIDTPGAPYIDTLIIRTVPEPQTRLAALRTGEVHIAEPPFDDVAAIGESGDLDNIYGDLNLRRSDQQGMVPGGARRLRQRPGVLQAVRV